MLSIVIMIVGGLVAAMNLIAGLVPKTKPLFDKMIPFQGIVGAFLIVWSVIGLVQLLSHGAFSILGIAVIAVQLLVGFLLSFALLSKFIFKTADSQTKSEELRAKLGKFQVPMGIALVVYGIWALLQIIIA